MPVQQSPVRIGNCNHSTFISNTYKSGITTAGTGIREPTPVDTYQRPGILHLDSSNRRNKIVCFRDNRQNKYPPIFQVIYGTCNHIAFWKLTGSLDKYNIAFLESWDLPVSNLRARSVLRWWLKYGRFEVKLSSLHNLTCVSLQDIYKHFDMPSPMWEEQQDSLAKRQRFLEKAVDIAKPGTSGKGCMQNSLDSAH